MKININKKVKLEAALRASNGKSVAHTISCIEEVKEIAERAERQLIARGVNQSNRKGCGVEYVPAGPAKAYRHPFWTTRITLVRGMKDWFLTSCETFESWPGSRELFQLRVTDLAFNQIRRLLTDDLVSADGSAFEDDSKRLTKQIKITDEQERTIARLQKSLRISNRMVQDARKSAEKDRRERDAAQRTVERLGGGGPF